MNMLQMLGSGLAIVFEPTMLLMVLFAVIIGTIFGALPGVSATMAVALGLPFTYTMQPVQAIVFLVAIYCSSITGGGITAILFKIPGVPSSAPTTLMAIPWPSAARPARPWAWRWLHPPSAACSPPWRCSC